MATRHFLPVSEQTLRRLSAYHTYLKRLQSQGRPIVSSARIGQDLRLEASLVRKDLAVTGVSGCQSGYEIAELAPAIESFLGWDDRRGAFLAGVGCLGMALLGHQPLADQGLEIIAGFDIDPRLVDTTVHGRSVLHIDRLAGLAQRMRVHVGILCVPPEAAQDVADEMIEGGIDALWNFTATTLRVPDHVVVQNENLASSLAVLSKRADHRKSSAPADASGAAEMRHE